MSLTQTLSEKFSTWREAVSEVEVDQLDWENPGSWPSVVKVFILVAVFVVCLLLGYSFFTKSQVELLNTSQAKEELLKVEFKQKAFEAANLDSLRKQMEEMQQIFGALVSQLPSDTEVPGLLEDITATGVDNGLEFQSIELQSELAQEFYIELPIDIDVTGSYHDLGAFVSGISGLPRIVTLHDFEILPIEDRPGVMAMKILAKTYRYKDEGEQ
ncbi:MAG: type 4a pilus biogenesis protein PilO [Cellvibrionales bacterium]|jgi:type IV pilus assembly protein PilO|nr:type 4a pilus biogenesis protein PilO [Cellvibrionales bacterium]